MKITVVIIDKKSKEPLYAPLIEHYIKSAKPFASIEVIEVFDKDIAKSHENTPQVAQSSYSKALQRYLGRGRTIAFDPSSSMIDSFGFADLLKDCAEVTLFIGGAYGFEENFLKQCDYSVSLGRITLSHKLVKVVVLEQLFRGLSINHNHPYHK